MILPSEGVKAAARLAAAGKVVAPMLALSPLAWLVDGLRQAVESRMLLHMLVQFPLLMAAGIAARAKLDRVAAPVMATIDRWDRQGLLGLTLLCLVSALWMIPAAVDLSLLVPLVAAMKYATWWLAGVMVAGSWNRLAPALELFLLGSLAWMLASVGLLFASTPSRLCVSYLQDEQVWTGQGLVALAVALGGAIIVRAQAPGRSRMEQPSPAERPVLP